MDYIKGMRDPAPGTRPSRHIFTSVLTQAPALRRSRCWAICPVADDLELEDWMVGSIDG